MQPGYGQPSAGERWNVNMPAVIGVVFVLLLGVVVWVIVSSGDDGSDAFTVTGSTTIPAVSTSTMVTSTVASAPPIPPTIPPTTPTTQPPATAATTPATAAATTTPAPMPATTRPADPPATAAPRPTSPPTPTTTTEPPTPTTTTEPPPPATPAPATTAPGSDPGTVPGDLGVPGRPMRSPACNGSYITVLASAIGGDASAASLAAVLDDYEGSKYLRTDETCPSLTQSSGGQPIFVVFFGPHETKAAACASRADGPPDAYVRRLSTSLPPDHFVDCG